MQKKVEYATFRMRGFLDTEGSAAVEFALLLPLMVLLFLAALQLSQEVTVARDFDLLTHTLADLTSRQLVSPSEDGSGYLNSYGYEVNSTVNTYQNQSVVTATILDSILTSATAIMSPYPTTSLVMTITAVDVVNKSGSGGVCCQFFVRWSYSTNQAHLRPCQALLTTASGITGISAALVPSNFALTAPVSIIISDTSYTYAPVLNGKNLGAITSGSALDMTINMARTQYVYPRNVGQIVLNVSSSGNPTQKETPVLSPPNMPTSYPSPISIQSFSGTKGTGQVCY